MVPNDDLAEEGSGQITAHRDTAAPLLEPPLSSMDRRFLLKPSASVARLPIPLGQNREGAGMTAQEQTGG